MEGAGPASAAHQLHPVANAEAQGGKPVMQGFIGMNRSNQRRLAGMQIAKEMFFWFHAADCSK